MVLDKEGRWVVITYVDDLAAYLLAGMFQSGAWLPVRALFYVDERTGAWRPSHVNGSRWMAMAAVPSRSGRFVAFVGDTEGEGFETQILSTKDDALVRVCEAPSPPPFPRDDWSLCPDSGRFTWGEGADGFVKLDRGILAFPNDQTLVISHGRDTCRRRERNRRVKRWNVPALLATGTRAIPAHHE